MNWEGMVQDSSSTVQIQSLEQPMTENMGWENITRDFSSKVQLKSIEFPEDNLLKVNINEVLKYRPKMNRDFYDYLCGYQQELNDNLRDLKTINNLLINNGEQQNISGFLYWLVNDKELSDKIDQFVRTKKTIVEHKSAFTNKLADVADINLTITKKVPNNRKKIEIFKKLQGKARWRN